MIVLVVLPSFFLLIVMVIYMVAHLAYLVDSFFRQVMEMAYSIAKERRDQELLEEVRFHFNVRFWPFDELFMSLVSILIFIHGVYVNCYRWSSLYKFL